MLPNTSHTSSNLAIIPARAGSKGIHDKNLMQIGSRNLIEHAIFTAQNSTLITHIIVSSDHPIILEIARSNGVFFEIVRLTWLKMSLLLSRLYKMQFG